MTTALAPPATKLIVQRQFYTFAEPPNPMPLDSGAYLGPITLAYETLGTLNSEASNAVLILHAFSGDSHVAGYFSESDTRPGWWDTMVGPGKAIDTNIYFVICINILGSCADLRQRLGSDRVLRQPYLVRVMLHPARLREKLREFFL